jgi:hypothetical protein
MNGNLKPFQPATLDLPDRETFIKSFTDQGLDKAGVIAGWEKAIRDEVWLNDEYQVNIDKNAPHGFAGLEIWHLSIKRVDKAPIHDWRDLQAIKNMLIGENYEAVELYPSDARKHDSANQYHLWVFIKDDDTPGKAPIFPIGWTNRFVNDLSKAGAVQRPFNKV